MLKTVGMTLLSTVGGASGPLYGTFFLEAAKVAAGKTELDRAGIQQSFSAGLAGIQKRGKAEPLDKTMVDALGPALVALEGAEGVSLAEALARMAEAARQGISVSICGEAAADPALAAIFVGLGIGRLSMGAASIPSIHAALLGASWETLQEAARQARER